MADLTGLAAAIAAADKEIAAENPYAKAGTITSGIDDLLMQGAGSGKYDLGELVAMALGSGLVGGTLKGFGDDYTAGKRDLLTSSMLGGIKSGNFSRPEGLTSAMWAPAETAGSLFRAQREMDLGDKQRELGIDTSSDIKKEFAKEFIKNPKRAAQKLAEYQQLMSGKDPESIIGEDPAQNSSTQRVDDKVIELARKIQEESDAPPGDALTTARELLKPELTKLQEAGQETSDIRKRANAALQLAEQSRSAISRAGETGGLLGATGIRDLASRLYAPFSSEEQAQRDAEAELESFKPDIIAASRPKGAGAMDKTELQAYLAAGPGSDKTPSANLAITNKLENIANADLDYANFIDWYRKQNGTNEGADVLWRQYTKENPLTIPSQTGEVVYNTDRTPWQNSSIIGLANKPSYATKGAEKTSSTGNISTLKDQLRALAAQFPNTPSGRAAFKREGEKLKRGS